MLQDLLQRRKDSVLEKWLNLILESFPSDSHRFLKLEKDQFSNPVGHTFREETATLLQSLIEKAPTEESQRSLNRIIRIRAVQDCPPSEATAFIFLLKQAIREELLDTLADPSLATELSECESRIDRLALAAFEEYMRCREKIYEIQARAERMRVAKLLERLSRTSESQGNAEGIHRIDV